MTPGLDKEQVVVTVSHNDQVLDRIIFKGNLSPSEIEKKNALHGVNPVQPQYDLPDLQGRS